MTAQRLITLQFVYGTGKIILWIVCLAFKKLILSKRVYIGFLSVGIDVLSWEELQCISKLRLERLMMNDHKILLVQSKSVNRCF